MSQTLISTFENDQSYITLKFGGDLTEKELPDFKAGLQGASELINSSYKKSLKKLRILLDMTDFSGIYSINALNILVEFAVHNKLFVEKTASFGGSDKIKMAGEAAIALSGRHNIEIFNTKEEALKWLFE